MPRLNEPKKEIPPTMTSPSQEKPSETNNNDDDDFDFVDEQESPAEESKPKEQPTESNDDEGFDFVEEDDTPSQKEQKKEPSPQPVISSIAPSSNSSKLNDLLLSYKTKHLKPSSKEKKEMNSDYKATTHIIDNSFDNISTTYSIKTLYETASNFKMSPKVEVRPFTYETMMKSVQKSEKMMNSSTRRNVFNSDNIFVKNVELQSNEFFNSLYINLGKINALFNKDLPIQEEINEYVEPIKEDNPINQNSIKVPNEENIKPIEPPLTKMEKTPTLQVMKGDNDENIDDDFVYEEDDQPQSNNIKPEEPIIDIPNTNVIVEEKPKEEPKIEISQDLLSLLSGPIKEEKFDENKMMEMLKKISHKEEKDNKEKDKEISNEEKEEDKNDKKLNDIISTLPNYNYLNSKYVEYPDSLFNL